MTTARRVFFFDLDGTLADSLGALRAAYDRFLALHGKRGSGPEFDALNGPTLEEIPLLLATTHALPGDVNTLRTEYFKCVLAVYEQVMPMPGVEDVIVQLRAKGWALAVVTANKPSLAERWLHRHGLRAHFDAVIGMFDGARGKPAPDLYLRALEVMKCNAESAVALEDSANGVRAAREARIRAFRYGIVDDQVESILTMDLVLARL